MECPSRDQRVSGRGLEIQQQKSCRERKSRDQEKHNLERLREQTGKTGWICGACRAAFTRKDAWKRHVMSRCAAMPGTNPPDHTVPEPLQCLRKKRASRTTRREPRGQGTAGQDDRPPDVTARIRAHGHGESREHRVRMRGKQRDNGSNGGQQSSTWGGGREIQEDQRRPVQGHLQGKNADAKFRMLAFRLATQWRTKRRLDTVVGALTEQLPGPGAKSFADSARHGHTSGEQKRHEGQEVLLMSDTKTARNSTSDGFWQCQLTRSLCKQWVS